MTIAFKCSCGKAYSVPDEFGGRKTKCRQCQAELLIPHAQQAISSVPPRIVPAPAAVAWPTPAASLAAPRQKRPLSPRQRLAMIGGGLLAAGLLILFAEGAIAYGLLFSSSASSAKAVAEGRPGSQPLTVVGTRISTPLVPPQRSEMDYLPELTQFVATIKVDELLASQTYREVEQEVVKLMPAEKNKNFTEELQKETGLVPSNVAALLVAGRFTDSQEPMFLFKTKKPVTAAEITANLTDKEFKGVKTGRYTLYEHPVRKEAFCVADGRLVIWGAASTLRPVLQRDRRAELSPHLQTALRGADASKTMTIAVDLKDVQANQFPGKLVDANAMDKLLSSMESLAGQASVNSEIQLQLAVQCKDDKAAADLNAIIVGGLVAAKNQNGIPKEVLDVINSIKVNANGPRLMGTAHFKAAPLFKVLLELGTRSTTTFERVGERIGNP